MDSANDRPLLYNPEAKRLINLPTDTSADRLRHPGVIFVNFFNEADK